MIGVVRMSSTTNCASAAADFLYVRLDDIVVFIVLHCETAKHICQYFVLVQYILHSGLRLRRYCSGGIGRLFRDVQWLGLGLVDRWGNWVL